MVPHARLLAVHTEAAEALPGVFRVLTFRDVAGSNRFGIPIDHQPVLVDAVVHFAGDPVALVLAESKEILSAALDLITVDYEHLPCIFDAEEALKDGAPKVREDNDDGNLMRAVSVCKGNPDDAFGECDAVAEGVFETSRQEHAYLETEAGWAKVDDRGVLTVVASTQSPYRDKREIARALGVGEEKVRVIAPYLGGAFGGKDGITVECLLGVAALCSGGRPVKMWWDRRESFLAGVKRLPSRMYFRLGANRDGTFHALSCRLYFDAGAYAGLAGEIMTMAGGTSGLRTGSRMCASRDIVSIPTILSGVPSGASESRRLQQVWNRQSIWLPKSCQWILSTCAAAMRCGRATGTAWTLRLRIPRGSSSVSGS